RRLRRRGDGRPALAVTRHLVRRGATHLHHLPRSTLAASRSCARAVRPGVWRRSARPGSGCRPSRTSHRTMASSTHDPHRLWMNAGTRRLCRAVGRMGGAAVAWVLVVIAGFFETGFAILLKQSETFTRLWPTVGFAACALISFGLLTWALRGLEIGPAYAVWTGLGTAGTAVVGIIVMDETASVLKLVSISLVLAGIVGLNLSGVTP